jgi:amino acid permease
MASDELEFLDRETLLGGGMAPGRRASALLFAIESRTARLVAWSQQATAWYLTRKAVTEREQEFLEALSEGRDLPIAPTIQEIERYAANWTSLVTDADAGLRAALARAMGQKYRLVEGAVPGIRAALGLDTAEVQAAYQRFYGESLASIYVVKVVFGERLRWATSAVGPRLEALPPFWVALALTLPVGPGLLALPIAVAGIGAVPGIVLLIIFGLLNALTAAALAETVARSGTTRFGLGYLGQLVSEYLGNAGSLLLTVILTIDNFLVLIVFYMGVAGTLEGTLRLPAELWIAVIFAVGLYFLSRKSLNSTVASALVVTAIDVVLLVVIPVFALPYIKPANLAYMQIPFVGGQPFNPAILTLIFGVMLCNFFSHMLIANYGKVIIRRDASARSWIWGCVAAIGVTTLISCLWVVTFNGALSPEALAQETGTALTALAQEVGPAVNWLGTVFVMLSLGMASIHVSLGLLFTVEERLPAGRLGKRARFLVSISPVVGVFLVTEWLSITGNGSFAGLLGFVGAIALPLLGGIFPVLLLASTRRKGDFVPGLVLRLLGNPVVLVGTYLVFLGAIFVYGLFIYQGTIQKAVTLLIGGAIVVVTIEMLRRGALRHRAVVELHADYSPGRYARHQFNVTVGGKPAVTPVRLEYTDCVEQRTAAGGSLPALASLCSAAFELAAGGASEVKVWTHSISPEWISEPLPTKLRVRCDGSPREFDLAQTGGKVTLPCDCETCRLTIDLPLGSARPPGSPSGDDFLYSGRPL